MTGMQFKYLLKGKIIFIPVLFFLFSCYLFFGCTTPAKIAADTLLIEGSAVKGKTSFTLEDLKSMEEGLVEADYFSKNSYGTEEYVHLKGIWVWYILEEKVGLKDHASKVNFIAEDGYEVEFTIEEVKREDYIDEHNPEAKYKMILAWEVDGKENTAKNTSPFQLAIGQREPGDENRPYWVRYVKSIVVD